MVEVKKKTCLKEKAYEFCKAIPIKTVGVVNRIVNKPLDGLFVVGSIAGIGAAFTMLKRSKKEKECETWIYEKEDGTTEEVVFKRF